jgi:hypothetical protein
VELVPVAFSNEVAEGGESLVRWHVADATSGLRRSTLIEEA